MESLNVIVLLTLGAEFGDVFWMVILTGFLDLWDEWFDSAQIFFQKFLDLILLFTFPLFLFTFHFSCTCILDLRIKFLNLDRNFRHRTWHKCYFLGSGKLTQS